MGMMIGGTMKDFAQQEVLVNFAFETKEVKKNIEEIFKERRITDKKLKTLCEQEADSMVKRRFLQIDEKGTCVFSKDNQGNYFWKEATFLDKITNYVLNRGKKYFY